MNDHCRCDQCETLRREYRAARDVARDERPSALDVEALRIVRGKDPSRFHCPACKAELVDDLARLTEPDAGGTEGVRDALDRPTGPMFTPDTTGTERSERLWDEMYPKSGPAMRRATPDTTEATHEHDAERCFGCAEVHERALAEPDLWWDDE